MLNSNIRCQNDNTRNWTYWKIGVGFLVNNVLMHFSIYTICCGNYGVELVWDGGKCNYSPICMVGQKLVGEFSILLITSKKQWVCDWVSTSNLWLWTDYNLQKTKPQTKLLLYSTKKYSEFQNWFLNLCRLTAAEMFRMCWKLLYGPRSLDG